MNHKKKSRKNLILPQHRSENADKSFNCIAPRNGRVIVTPAEPVVYRTLELSVAIYGYELPQNRNTNCINKPNYYFIK